MSHDTHMLIEEKMLELTPWGKGTNLLTRTFTELALRPAINEGDVVS